MRKGPTIPRNHIKKHNNYTPDQLIATLNQVSPLIIDENDWKICIYCSWVLFKVIWYDEYWIKINSYIHDTWSWKTINQAIIDYLIKLENWNPYIDIDWKLVPLAIKNNWTLKIWVSF